MFSKVLIADDLVSVNTGVHTVLSQLAIPKIEQVNYCDDAFLQIKAALKYATPFELLITDLSFKVDHRDQKIKTGDALAIQLKASHPDLKIIVYSIEDKPQLVRHLIYRHGIDGYVCKGRRGLTELTEAVRAVYSNKTYVSPHLETALRGKSVLEIDDYDIELLKQLANGLVMDEIARKFKEEERKPFSPSAIEKRMGTLRTQFGAKNSTQLIAKAKDLGLI